jgi:putative Holliday junction resolvase
MRALGVDYGRRRIGLALSDASGTLARPWKTIQGHAAAAAGARALATEVAALARADEAVAVIVIGHPRRLDGQANEQTAAAEQLAGALRALVDVPVMMQDERLTSREAEALLARRERDWRKRKALLDAMAAAVILQDYLDSQATHDAAGVEDDQTCE